MARRTLSSQIFSTPLTTMLWWNQHRISSVGVECLLRFFQQIQRGQQMIW